MRFKKALAIISGGLDSAAAAALAQRECEQLCALHFNYHQLTEAAEERAFAAVCDALGIAERLVVPMDFFTRINAGALLGRGAVGLGEIGSNEAPGELPATYVPFRNGIFFSIAAAAAQSLGAEAIYSGLIDADASSYPDTTLEFAQLAERFIAAGTGCSIAICAPLLGRDKTYAARVLLDAGVPLEITHSCYVSNAAPCGQCESCRLRERALARL